MGTDIAAFLKNLEYLKLSDDAGNTFSGCDQEWFGSCWQRQSGCGPSVATNVLLYLHGAGIIGLPKNVNNKVDCIRLMEILWGHVTPTEKGVHTLDRFCNGVKEFTQTQGASLECRALGIPNVRMSRPSLPLAVDFIASGLNSNCPVAFLNLCNGKVSNLDRWHWVTIVGLKIDQENHVFAKIFDGGKAFEIDLKLWYETTTLGGGFVFFEKPRK